MIGPVSNNFTRNLASFSPLTASPQSSLSSPLTGASNNSAAGALLGTGNVSFMQVAQQVSQLLQSIGGGLQNDPNLQMVIGLLIMMALLSQSQQANAPVDLSNLIGRGGGGGSGGGNMITAYSSYTSISISSGDLSMTASASQIYASISSPQGLSRPTFDTQA